MSATGAVTQAGRHWYTKLAQKPIPSNRWDDNAKTYRKPGGRTDFVKTKSGCEVQLRSWDPATRAFRYTALGKEFYKRRPKSYIVQVPVNIYVRKRDGTERSYQGTYPASDFNAELRRGLEGVVGSEAQAQADIKRKVREHLGDKGTYKG